MSKIDKDAQHYWAILRTPADGWGAHCDPKTGQRSDWFMLACWREHGQQAFDDALARHHPYPQVRKTT